MYKKFIFLFLFFCFTTTINAQQELTGFGKIYPMDESRFDESFSEFYTNLMAAIESKDVNFIFGCIHPEIQLNEHEEEKNGIGYFKIQFDLNDSENEFWKIFKKILTLGGSRSDYDTSFYFPSDRYSDSYTEIFGDGVYSNILIAGNINLGSASKNNVNVYKEKNENSDIIGILNYEIVLILNYDYNNSTPWYRIELKNEEKGFVKSEFIYLAILDYYCSFKKIDDKWYLVALETTCI